jgi:protoporphyrinogen oxidase
MKTLVLGAGLAGLGAGIALNNAGCNFEILEASSSPGGLAKTDNVQGFYFDRAGHFLHCKSAHLEQFFFGLGIDLEKIPRRAAVVLDGKLIPFPLQYNLWALEESVRRQIQSELQKSQQFSDVSRNSLKDFFLSCWGETLTELFLRPYNEKLWGRDLAKLPGDCLGSYLPQIDMQLVKDGFSRPVTDAGYNAFFYYPSSGRIGELGEALADPLKGNIRYQWPVCEINTSSRTCIGPAGQKIYFDQLISTIPIPKFLKLANISWPFDEYMAVTQLINLRVGFRGKMNCDYHWIYVSESQIPFFRVGFPHNVNPKTCPNGCASLSIEYSLAAPRDHLEPTNLAYQSLDYLTDLDLIRVQECLTIHEILISPAYIINRAPSCQEIQELITYLASIEILVAGRFGAWDYLSMEESFDSGLKIANEIIPL